MIDLYTVIKRPETNVPVQWTTSSVRDHIRTSGSLGVKEYFKVFKPIFKQEKHIKTQCEDDAQLDSTTNKNSYRPSESVSSSHLEAT